MGISLGTSEAEDAAGVAPAGSGSAAIAARKAGGAGGGTWAAGDVTGAATLAAAAPGEGAGAGGVAAAAAGALAVTEGGEGRETDEGAGPDMKSVLANAGFLDSGGDGWGAGAKETEVGLIAEGRVGWPMLEGAGPAGAAPMGLATAAATIAGLFASGWAAWLAGEGPEDTGAATSGLATAKGGCILRAASAGLAPAASASGDWPKRDGMGKGGGAAMPKMVLLALALP